MPGRSGQAAGGRPVGLTRDRVLDVAMEIVEADGADRLTVRGLAANLGVAPTAIYWHVGNHQDLLDGLSSRVAARLGQLEARGRDPVTRIASIARTLRERLLERAGLVALVHRQGRTAELFQPARRALVGELAGAGVHGTESALFVQALLNLVVGSVLLDRQLERQPRQRRSVEELWSPGDTPGDPELLAQLARPVDEQQLFDFTVGVVVEAVVSRPGGGRADPGDRRPT